MLVGLHPDAGGIPNEDRQEEGGQGLNQQALVHLCPVVFFFSLIVKVGVHSMEGSH